MSGEQTTSGEQTMSGEQAMSEPDVSASAAVRSTAGDGLRRSSWNGPRLAAIFVGLLVVGLVGVLATRQTAIDRDEQSTILGKTAPPFSGLSILDGKRVSLSEQRGKWVVLNVFASWCVPCVKEHPELVTFQENNSGPNADVVVISAVFQDPKSDVQKFFKKFGGSWPVLDNAELIVNYGVTKVPETFLISPAGQVLWKQNRQISAQMLEDAVAEGRQMMTASSNAVPPETTSP
jgi:cytochrome c biogenesis protein CcmG, thiol:disulfide interchange protein DsbE